VSYAYSAAAVALVKESEGCLLVAYCNATDGTWTQGWGNTHGVTATSPPITQAEADAQLEANLNDVCDTVNQLVFVPLTQGQIDALVDFVYEVGETNFECSTLLRKLNAGDYDGAAAEFPKWVHAKGQVLSGMVTRRERELALWNQALPLA